MKIIDNLRDGYEILKTSNISSYKIDCEILMSQILSISREEVLLNLEKKIKREEKEKYLNLVNRRKKNEPIAYIINNKNFWRDNFITNKNEFERRDLLSGYERLVSKRQMGDIFKVNCFSDKNLFVPIFKL